MLQVYARTTHTTQAHDTHTHTYPPTAAHTFVVGEEVEVHYTNSPMRKTHTHTYTQLAYTPKLLHKLLHTETHTHTLKPKKQKQKQKHKTNL